MARRDNARYGLQISQAGIPLGRAADYQKQLDDRWPYIDIALESAIEIDVLTWPASTEEFVKLATHDLGYLPLFYFREETEILGFDSSFGENLIATKHAIYLVKYSGGVGPVKIKGMLRVFAVDCSNGYTAPAQDIAPYSAIADTTYGAKVLKRGKRRIDSKSVSDFAINTEAKALAIHRSGIQHINPWADGLLTPGSVTSINTTTDTLTVSGSDLTWMTTGTAVTYTPNDYFTYPSPLGSGTYYVIQMSGTTCKLATSEANAYAGTAINITTGGSLPGSLGRTGSYDDDESTKIYHNLGYPPTYLIARTYERGRDAYAGFWDSLGENEYIDPIHSLAAKALATTQYVQFIGVQEVLSGKFAFVIIKDPAEVAA